MTVPTHDSAGLPPFGQYAAAFQTAEDESQDEPMSLPDLVDLITPPATHRAHIERIVAHGIPVICQKPFAPSLADATAIVEACERAGVPLMVHENFRWQSAIQRVKQVMEAGEIGPDFWGRVSFRSSYDVFSGQPYLAEGKRFIVEDLGIHALDIARFLLGDVTRVSAQLKRVNPMIKGEDVATILLEHQSGTTSVVDCSYATRQEVEPFPETLLEVDGSLGSLRLRQGYRLAVTSAAGTRHA